MKMTEQLIEPLTEPLEPQTQIRRMPQITQRSSWIEDLGNGVYLRLVTIPSGKFLMGSPQGYGCSTEYPQHEVTVNSFAMGMYLVTQRQWQQVAQYPMVKHPLSLNPSHFKGDNYPVEQVSWQEAMEFCARLSQRTSRHYRLPSEAEWEYACRAGTTTPFHFGTEIAPHLVNHLTIKASDQPIGQKSGKQTTEVGLFPPNPFQIYDLHGNVWEWCLDHWHDDYHGAPIDGRPWLGQDDSEFRVLRGGAWNMTEWVCRSAFRYAMKGEDWGSDRQRIAKYFNIGLRVVCNYPGSPAGD